MQIKYIPLSQVPAAFGLSRSSVYRAARAGQIEIKKVGRTSLIPVESLENFLACAPSLYPGANTARRRT